MTDSILYSRHAEIITLTLNRPERSNALSHDLLKRFSLFLDDIRAESRCSLLLLKAEGKNFCGGLDLKEAALSPENARMMPALVVEILAKLRQLPQIVVSVVHGAARAGGGGLVVASDYVLAAENFTIAFPEVQRGLKPALLFPLLRRKLSSSALSELLLSGGVIEANRARQLGLVHRIIVNGRKNHAADDYIRELFAANLDSVRFAKELILQNETERAGCPLEEEFNTSLERHLESWFSPDGREGVSAFLEKREPQWDRGFRSD